MEFFHELVYDFRRDENILWGAFNRCIFSRIAPIFFHELLEKFSRIARKSFHELLKRIFSRIAQTFITIFNFLFIKSYKFL